MGVRAKLAPFLPASISFGNASLKLDGATRMGYGGSGTSSNPEPAAGVKPVEALANPPLSPL